MYFKDIRQFKVSYFSATIGPPANAIRMAFHWWAVDGPLFYHYWMYPNPQHGYESTMNQQRKLLI